MMESGMGILKSILSMESQQVGVRLKSKNPLEDALPGASLTHPFPVILTIFRFIGIRFDSVTAGELFWLLTTVFCINRIRTPIPVPIGVVIADSSPLCVITLIGSLAISGLTFTLHAS